MIHVKILKQSDKTHFLDLSSSYTKYECYNLLLPNCLYLLSTAYCSLSFWCLPVAVAAREGRGGYADFKDRSRGRGFYTFRHSSRGTVQTTSASFLVYLSSLSIFMVDVDMWIFAVSSTLMSPFFFCSNLANLCGHCSVWNQYLAGSLP